MVRPDEETRDDALSTAQDFSEMKFGILSGGCLHSFSVTIRYRRMENLLASDWASKIRTLVPAKLRTSMAAVTAATIVGGGAAFVVLPHVEHPTIPAEPARNDAVVGVYALALPQTDLASRSGVDRVSRDAARSADPATTQAASADTSAVAEGGSFSKLTAVAKPADAWTTTSLRVRAEASSSGQEVTVLSKGAKVRTTGIKHNGWAEISLDGKNRWVSGEYLTSTEPKPVAPRSTSGQGSDSSGSNSQSGGSQSASANSESVAPTGGGGSCRTQLSGLTSRARTLHNAMCANFPQITSYGGVRADAYPAHPSGRAIDAMIPNWQSASGNGLGWSVANWLRGNAGTYGISEIIFDQTIWTSQRSGDGWRSMSNRGSATANHRDHVHVAVR